MSGWFWMMGFFFLIFFYNHEMFYNEQNPLLRTKGNNKGDLQELCQPRKMTLCVQKISSTSLGLAYPGKCEHCAWPQCFSPWSPQSIKVLRRRFSGLHRRQGPQGRVRKPKKTSRLRQYGRFLPDPEFHSAAERVSGSGEGNGNGKWASSATRGSGTAQGWRWACVRASGGGGLGGSPSLPDNSVTRPLGACVL